MMSSANREDEHFAKDSSGFQGPFHASAGRHCPCSRPSMRSRSGGGGGAELFLPLSNGAL